MHQEIYKYDEGRIIHLFADPKADPVAKLSGFKLYEVEGEIIKVNGNFLEIKVRLSNTPSFFRDNDTTKKIPILLIKSYSICD